MASQRKREIEDENRTFQVEWEKLYFFYSGERQGCVFDMSSIIEHA